MTPRPVRWNCPAGNEIDHVWVLLLDRIEAALRAEAERSHLAGLEFTWHEDPTLNAAVQRAGAGPTLEIHTARASGASQQAIGHAYDRVVSFLGSQPER